MALKDLTSSKLTHIIEDETDPTKSPLAAIIDAAVEERLQKLSGTRRLININWLTRTARYPHFSLTRKGFKGVTFDLSPKAFADLALKVAQRGLKPENGFEVSLVVEIPRARAINQTYLCIICK